MSPTLIFPSFIIAAYLPSLQPFSNPVMKQLLLVKRVQTGSTHRPLGIQSILRCSYNSPSIPSDSFFQDPTLKHQTRIMLLKTQYQKVWLFSWFSHGGLPVPLDQYNLLKTFFSTLLLLLNLIQKGPICSSYIIRRALHFHTAAELSVPLQKLELLHAPPWHRNYVKKMIDPKTYCMIISTLAVSLM